MSLVGNLEDLSLGDILQIISLSQKSGVLALSGDAGTGRIVFRSGLVHAACLKGGPNALRDLLVHHACIDPAGYDAAQSRAVDRGVPIEEMLESEAGLSQERINELITVTAESAILEMFSWPSGDFSFDVRNELDPEDPQLILAKGINAQYLAMEGLRIHDERERDQRAGSVDPNAETDPNIGVAEDPLFGNETFAAPVSEAESLDSDPHFLDLGPDSAESAASKPVLEDAIFDAPEQLLTAADTLVARVVERSDAAYDLTFDDVAAAMPLESLPDSSSVGEIGPRLELTRESEALAPERTAAFAAPTERVPEAPATAPAPEELPSIQVAAASSQTDSAQVTDVRKMPVVLIDPDVTVLEWVKAAICDDFARVHVFQQADLGLSRIRQYLIRGETPLVLLSPEIQIDPLSGIRGLSDFVKRLKAQSQRLIVLGLRDDEDAAPSAMPGTLNGVLRRPAKRMLAEKNGEEGAVASQVLARALLEILAQQGPRPGVRKKPSPGMSSLRGLRDTTAKL